MERLRTPKSAATHGGTQEALVPAAATLRVLGIDPGSRIMGYGVVEQRGSRVCHVGHGILKVDEGAPLELRLKDLFAGLAQVVALYGPTSVAVEGLFTFRNARSALILGHARGVALLAASQAGLGVHEYAPAKVKRSVGAGGADSKDAVAKMVARLLEVPEVLDERADATDALAVAICHLSHLRVGQLTGSGIAPTRAGGARKGKGAFGHLADRLAPAYQKGKSR